MSSNDISLCTFKRWPRHTETKGMCDGESRLISSLITHLICFSSQGQRLTRTQGKDWIRFAISANRKKLTFPDIHKQAPDFYFILCTTTHPISKKRDAYLKDSPNRCFRVKRKGNKKNRKWSLWLTWLNLHKRLPHFRVHKRRLSNARPRFLDSSRLNTSVLDRST